MKNRFAFKHFLSVAVFAWILGMVGCDSGAIEEAINNADPDAAGGFETINAPKGTITGHVQDTNGNPIAECTVYFSGTKRTTNKGGNYVFADVAVTQTVKLNVGNNLVPALSITIVPPTGYLGATVTVLPTAQIFETDTGTNAETDTNSTTTFIDGFLVQAGTAVLPATNATVKGVVRRSDTEAPVGSVSVGLDFDSVGAVNQEQPQDG